MNSEKEYLSIDLAFEWVKGVLVNQIKEVDALDNKVVALFSLATLIVSLGIGIPLGIKAITFRLLMSSIISWIFFTSYLCIAGLASFALWVRYYERMQNPVTIREWYWDITPLEFKTNILSHLEDAYATNQRKLLQKGWAIRFLVPLVAVEALLLILLFGFTLYGL